MTSLIIILVSAIAITTLIGLNAWLGGWIPSRIESLQAAAERIRQDYPGFNSGDGILANDGRAALLEDQGRDRIGMVLTQGDIFVSRIVRPDNINRIDSVDGKLDIHFHDFTLPRAVIDLADIAVADHWKRRLTGDINA